MRRVLVVAILFLALLGPSWADEYENEGKDKDVDQYGLPKGPGGALVPIQSAVFAGDGQILMRLEKAVSNWNQTAALFPGFKGWNDEMADPCKGGKNSWWSGISCEGGRVVAIDLSNIGLDGFLPAELLQIPTLKSLNLSNNYFHGPLPPQWSSQSLENLDLSNNVLSGPLPSAYGTSAVFPMLSFVGLHGNLLTGALPSSQWTSGFAQRATVALRPGNDGLCGAVPMVDPAILTSADPNGATLEEIVEKLSAIAGMNSQYPLSRVYFVHEGILDTDTSVLITNTLGSCGEPCGQTFTVKTNLIDATWEYNVTLADILANNPGLTPAEATPGTQLALPCYPDGIGAPKWFCSDAALEMFAGGHQMGAVGNSEAELAGGVVKRNGLGQNGVYFDGNFGLVEQLVVANGTTVPPPLYWFVKLDADFTVSAVSITAGNEMTGVTLYVGDDASYYKNNQIVQQGLNFAPGETKVVPVDHLMGKLVVLDAGDPTTGKLSLSHVQVWPAEGNAALNKDISTAGPLPSKANLTTDGSLSTCVVFKSVEGEDSVWFGVDLGYRADVAVVALTFGKDSAVPQLNMVQMYVSSDDSENSLSNSTACEAPYPETVPGKGHHAVAACGLKGRYVGVQVLGLPNVTVCELEVFLANAPDGYAPDDSDGDNTVAIAVGSAIGGAAAAFAIVGVVVYWRRSRRQRRLQDASAAEMKGSGFISMTTFNGSGNSSDPDAMEAGKAGAGVRHDSITSGAGGVSNVGLFRKLMGINSSSFGNGTDSGRSSPAKLSTVEGANPSTDLSKFTDGCDIVDFREIELIRTIGEGSFGLVWMGRYLQTTVAVKILTHDLKRDVGIDRLSEQQPSDQVMAALQREASIMAGLRHPNCIQYLGATLNPPALIMEYCSKRSVDTILAAAILDPKLAKQLDWMHLLSMACDAAKGMLYLHTRNPVIVHRDLKSPNLLVDGLWHVKVSDFNLSRALETNSVVSSLQITNPRWLAPEVLKGGQAGTAADVYSFGVVLWELLTWKLPWGHNTNPFSIINSVGSGETLPIPSPNDLPAGPLVCFDAYVQLMKECWSTNPADRPTMDEIAQRLRTMLTEMVQGKIDAAAEKASGSGSSGDEGASTSGSDGNK